MAYPENPTAGKTVRYGIAVGGATFGTEANAGAGTDVVEITCDDFDIDPGLNVQDVRISHGSNQPIAEESVRNLSGSMGAFTITGPVNTHTLGLFAGAFFQTGTWADTTFTGAFTPYDVGSHPQFNGDQKALTVYKRDAVAGRDKKALGVLVTGFKLTGEKKGLVRFEAVCISKSTAIDQTLGGTWQTSGSAADNYGRVHYEDLTFQLNVGAGATNVCAQSFEVSNTYDQVTQECPDGAGSYDQFGLTGITGTWAMPILKDGTSQTAEASLRAGTIATLTIGGLIDIVTTGKFDAEPEDRAGLTSVALAATMMASDENTDMISINW
ncbi:hypothetical protein KAR91_23450 [Candidatus Pacearchaeota archaeon]|nr:hypothetical protein [Candidatus Pacearchaeota archaeon]